MESPRVLLFQRLVPHYRVSLFEALYRALGIVVCHSLERRQATLSSAGRLLQVPNLLLRRMYLFGKETACIQNPLPALWRFRPRVVVSEVAAAYGTLWILLLVRPLFRYRLLAWTHGLENKELYLNRPTLGSFLRKFALRRVDGIISYSEQRAALLKERYGICNPIFIAPNTVESARYFSRYSELASMGRQRVRESLGWGTGVHLLFIGRLLKDRNLEATVSALEHAISRLPTTAVTFHIVGDGPELPTLKSLAGHRPWLKVYGKIENFEDTTQMLYASDLLLTLGPIGLSAVNALIMGLPVFAILPDEKGPYHGPEFDYLAHKKNAWLVPNNDLSIQDGLVRVVSDSELRNRLSQGALGSAASSFSTEKFIEGFRQALLSEGAPS